MELVINIVLDRAHQDLTVNNFKISLEKLHTETFDHTEIVIKFLLMAFYTYKYMRDQNFVSVRLELHDDTSCISFYC